MSTYNALINPVSWTKVVESTDTDFLITWDSAKVVEFAATDVDAEPTVRGHRISREARITRDEVGYGFVWAKSAPGGASNSIPLTVSKTQSTSGAIGGFDINEGVHKVAMLAWNASLLTWERVNSGGLSGGGGGSVTESTPTTKRIESFPLYMYVGDAAVGTSEASTGWLIKKIELNTGGDVTAVKIATGSWNNRAVLNYQ